MTNSISTIALDGPAASGKSTLGKKLAEKLNLLFFDTGVMYRAVTLIALESNLNLQDEAAIAKLAQNTQIEIKPPSKNDGRAFDIFVGANDITWDVRRADVDANVSLVSAYAGVRQALTEQQRRIGLRGRVVMVGRDIGTVVLPEADIKIYLDASAEQRARRRYDELIARNEKADYDEILKKVIERDRVDSTRALAPLRPAADAAILNSDGLDREQVLEQALKLCQ